MKIRHLSILIYSFSLLFFTPTAHAELVTALSHDNNDSATDSSTRWAKHAGGNYTAGLCNSDQGESGEDIVVDAQGNIYVAGTFRDTADIFGTQLVSGGGFDTFLSKFDAQGNTLWSKQATGLNSIQNPSIALDTNGNIFISGHFSNSATLFGAAVIANGNSDGYLIKLDNNGNLLWSKTFGGAHSEYSSSVFVDSANHVYVTGFFNSRTVDSDLFGTNLRSHGYSDGFIAKLDNNGNGIWTKSIYSDNEDRILDAVVDSDGNVYVSGFFSSTADIFGFSLTSAGQYDAFVAKLNSDGTGLWVQQAGADQRDQADSLAIDSNADIYVTGRFRNTADLFSQMVVGASRDNAFVVKMHSDGTLSWLKHLSDNSAIYSKDIAISDDTVYTIGAFWGDISVDAQTITSHGGYDIYTAAFDAANGNSISLEADGGTGWDYGEAISVNSSGSAYITGRFKDSINLYGTDLNSYGCYDIFSAQYLKGTPAPETTKIQAAIISYLLF